MNYSDSPNLPCTSSSFTTPVLYGAEILSLTANLVTNYSTSVKDIYWFNHPTTKVNNISFCNVTVTYTHPGQNENINVSAWLPEVWNERLQAVGGGGWVAGGVEFFLANQAMAGAIGTGYASITTDAGLDIGPEMDASRYALVSEGNVNLYNLQNFGSVSLNDEAIIGKSLIKNYYGVPPKYSYWSGCSQGGRQGLMIAQRYPTQYDGIAAAAPAINWNSFFTSAYWPQLVMNLAGQYPNGCELETITKAAVSACDGLDGVVDGVITDIKACAFDPFTIVGNPFNCSTTGKIMKISEIAATVANATWTGARTVSGGFSWYGPHIGADISGTLNPNQATAATICSTNGTCIGNPTVLGTQWITLFIEKNPDFNLANMTLAHFDEVAHAGRQQYSNMIDTNDPDLSAFKAAGGKMITYHGIADPIIPIGGTEQYYDAVTALDTDVKDFYRFFEVPGLQHCDGGTTKQPTSTFEALVAWVERDVTPETLPVTITNNGTTFDRVICPYPAIAVYDGVGEKTASSSFKCT